MNERERLKLLHQANKLREYVEDHFGEISEAKAREGVVAIHNVFATLERRKEGRNGRQ